MISILWFETIKWLWNLPYMDEFVLLYHWYISELKDLLSFFLFFNCLNMTHICYLLLLIWRKRQLSYFFCMDNWKILPVMILYV